MELKILNNILFKELMPWTFDAKDTRAINEKIIKLGNKDPTTEAELVQQLQILLADYSDLSKWLTKQNSKNTSPLKNHCFAIDFSDYSNAITKFYCKIISLETLRVYNAFNIKMQKYSNNIDIKYHTTVVLKNIKALTVNTVKEIRERGFEEAPTEQISLPHFVLELLRKHLIILFFDIQESSKASIDNPVSIEDFYILDLNLPKTQIKELVKIEVETEKAEKPTTKAKLSFGFNGNKEKLKTIILQLYSQIELLNEGKSTTDQLFEIFTSKNIIPSSSKIYINCETSVFRYVIDKLGDKFSNLTPIAIERSSSFYSKKGTPLNAQNLYSSKVLEPKQKEIIDNIIKQLQ
ncbi:MAG: DUF6617 family protein [Bacteroidota bacterium]|nr:DUF6617 family protein [Bacteroidota bacterium]